MGFVNASHHVILQNEIGVPATISLTKKQPSNDPKWDAVLFLAPIVAICYISISIVCYGAYGREVGEKINSCVTCLPLWVVAAPNFIIFIRKRSTMISCPRHNLELAGNEKCSLARKPVTRNLPARGADSIHRIKASLLLWVVALVPIASGNPTTDMEALMDFKNNLISENSSTDPLSGWKMTDSTPCNWTGITCFNGSVTQLSLSSLNLSGTISPKLQKLQNLQILDLSFNRLSGRIPAELGNMSALQQLILESNGFWGTLPVELTNLPNLQALYLGSNLLSGPIPSSIGKLYNLQTLDLSSNGFTSYVPIAIGNCTNLSVLDLSSNMLSGPIPSSIGKLYNLQDLYLSSNYFNSTIPSTFGNCRSLQILFLSNNSVYGSIPDELSNLTNIMWLDLSVNLLYGKIPSWISIWQGLSYLFLGNNKFSGEIPQELCWCSRLQSLDLPSNNLSGSIPYAICSNTTLISLYLDDNNFEGSIPEACNTLKYLYLSSNRLSGNLPSYMNKFTSLSVLYLSNNNFTGSLVQGLCKSNSSLRELYLDNNGLEDRDLEIVRNCSQLRYLHLDFNNFQGSIPRSIGNMSFLIDISISNNNINGNIPSELSNCSRLSYMNLANNAITGIIPASLGLLLELKTVMLSHNNFFGEIPPEISNLAKLRTLDLSFNNLIGTILSKLVLCKDLTRLNLASNNFSGIIPDNFSSLTSLEYLNISNNQLSNSIPEAFFSLQKLLYLDLSHNMFSRNLSTRLSEMNQLLRLYLQDNFLSGTLDNIQFTNLTHFLFMDLSTNHFEGIFPSVLCNISTLYYLNVSNNHLSGVVPYVGICTELNAASFSNNDGLCEQSLQKRCVVLTSKEKSTVQFQIEIIMSIGLLFIITFIILVWQRRRKWKRNFALRSSIESSHSNEGSSYLPAMGEPLEINISTFESHLRKYNLNEILLSTNGFSKENSIGEGGFGQVYKAAFESGLQVAIKRLSTSTIQGDREFFAEMETLGKVKHMNLVSLLGYCSFNGEKLLIYEYMSNGSLEFWLQNQRSSLDWSKRLHIMIGTAQGLDFLHHMIPHIIHRDMKTSNILLDGEFKPKISDFGLARLINMYDTHVSTNIAGTCGYIPPEYGHSKCTVRGDVYSFGVILLELLTGRKPTGNVPEVETGNLVDLVRHEIKDGNPCKILDPSVAESNETAMLKVLHLAVMCTSDDPKQRPGVKKILNFLQKLKPIAVTHVVDYCQCSSVEMVHSSIPHSPSIDSI